MVIADRDINVSYYKVLGNTWLFNQVAAYHDNCVRFIEKAEDLVEKYAADSANRMQMLFDTKVTCLNFRCTDRPFRWEMSDYGAFRPKARSREASEFDIALPNFMGGDPRWHDLRMGSLAEEFILSARPGQDGDPIEIEHAALLTEQELQDLQASASDKEIEHFSQLSRFIWSPAPFRETDVFTPSKEVLAMNQERLNPPAIETVLKHSPLGLALRKCCFSLGFC